MLLARLAPCATAALLNAWPTTALAQREATREALSRAQESLAMRFEDGGLVLEELVPAIAVSVTPAFEQSRAWYPTAALAALVRVLGAGGVRSCEACMSPRLYAAEGRIEQLTGAPGAAEITRLDEAARGAAAPARTAVWLDETAQGVSLRIVDLASSRILLAENFEATLSEGARTRTTLALARELDRRARGDSLTHAFFDVAMYPGQHLSLDWSEQWGDTNANLSGLSLSFFDPVLGIGAAYHRVVPSALAVTVGVKLLLSLPTALVRAVGDSGGLLDPLMTGVFLLRVPIARSNYAVILSASTRGRFGIGLSLMNTSLLPFLP